MLKRFMDATASATLLVLLSPMYVAVALAVLLLSGRPIFYSQTRIGRNFLPFRIHKFRTMRAAVRGPNITVGTDPRITLVGRWLRATKLDELPQLWNVLKGDMSLVGPRPEVAQYVDLFHTRYRRILAVRPGITDLASIRFRNEEEILARSSNPLRAYAEVVLPIKLDLADEYVRQSSIALDLAILGRTLVCLIPGISACLSTNTSARY